MELKEDTTDTFLVCISLLIRCHGRYLTHCILIVHGGILPVRKAVTKREQRSEVLVPAFDYAEVPGRSSNWQDDRTTNNL